jgi:hypothetical protein
VSAEAPPTDDLQEIADAVLERVGRGDAEVTVHDLDLALTRFANNGIHQNVAWPSFNVKLVMAGEVFSETGALDGSLAAVMSRRTATNPCDLP